MPSIPFELAEYFTQSFQNHFDLAYQWTIKSRTILMKNIKQWLSENVSQDEIKEGIERYIRTNSEPNSGQFIYWFKNCFINSYRAKRAREQQRETEQQQSRSELERMMADCSHRIENSKPVSFQPSF